MALNANILKANAVLSGLTEEQVTAIVTLSTNDESTQIGTRIGELHGRYDTDVSSVTGIQKNQGEKSYDYVKRVLTDYKTKLVGVSEIEAQLINAKADKADLQKKLNDNAGDATVKQQLVDANARLQQLQASYDTDKLKFETEKGELTTKMHTTRVEHQFDSALAGIKIKPTIPDSVRDILLENAKRELFATTKPEFAEIAGKQVLVFRDANGAILNNPENKLNPYTATELLQQKLKDVVDPGRKQNGSGSGTPPHDQSSIVDISGAKSQVDADEIIQKHLLQSGLTKTDPAFSGEQAKLRKEYAVEKLPIR